jgi:hypothetical protein
MRKIVTQGEMEEKARRNKILIGSVLVILMVISTAGYAFFSGEKENSSSEKITYNGIDFVRGDSGVWAFEFQNRQFLTQYNPQETGGISSLILRSPGDYSGQPLFFLGQSGAVREIEYNLRSIVTRTQEGCIQEYEKRCNNATPIKNCSTDNVIIIEESNNTKITQEENCIFIEAPYENQTMAGDAFIFKVLGIQ